MVYLHQWCQSRSEQPVSSGESKDLLFWDYDARYLSVLKRSLRHLSIKYVSFSLGHDKLGGAAKDASDVSTEGAKIWLVSRFTPALNYAYASAVVHPAFAYLHFTSQA